MDQLDYKKLYMRPDEITVVIYHDKCIDGFASAFCSYLYFKNTDKQIEYIKGKFDMDIPNLDNENVLVCDFSFKKNIIDDILKKVNKLVILDHHKSAEEDLEWLSEKNKIFDSNYSGAFLTWNYFFPGQTVPKFIEYVQDNDLWSIKLDCTKQIIAYMNTIKFNFTEYEKLLDDSYLDQIKIIGSEILKKNLIYVESKVNEAQVIFMKIKDQYYFVPHVQSYTNKSEIGHFLNETYINTDFSVIYSYDKEKNKTFFSLRSNNNNMDTTKISLIFSGGGHRNSSGFILEKSHRYIPGTIIDKKIYNSLRALKIKKITLDIGDNNLEFYSVILNSGNHKRELGEYLLQYRDYNENIIQQCVYIYMNNNKVKDNNNMECAILWHDRKDTMTCLFTIIIEQSLQNNLLESIKKYLENINISVTIKNNTLNFEILKNHKIVHLLTQ